MRCAVEPDTIVLVSPVSCSDNTTAAAAAADKGEKVLWRRAAAWLPQHLQRPAITAACNMQCASLTQFPNHATPAADCFLESFSLN